MSTHAIPMDVEPAPATWRRTWSTPAAVQDTDPMQVVPPAAASPSEVAQSIGWYYGVHMDGCKLPYMQQKK